MYVTTFVLSELWFETQIFFWIMGVDLFTCASHLHDSIISLRKEVKAHNNSLTPSFFLKCVYQARKACGHACCLFLRFPIGFWNCVVFVFFIWWAVFQLYLQGNSLYIILCVLSSRAGDGVIVLYCQNE